MSMVSRRAAVQRAMGQAERGEAVQLPVVRMMPLAAVGVNALRSSSAQL